MAAALYHPELGYYAREPRQVGRGGDFFTSVSVGPLFGELLARRFLKEWEHLGSPGSWRIIECGAHDGTLAVDILGAISRLQPAAFVGLEYAIPEPLPRLQAAQRETLAAFEGKTRLVRDAGELSPHPLPGVVFGNELLDALPFHVVEWHGGRWHECRVATHDDAFVWETAPEVTEPLLLDALAPLGNDFTDGYRTEIRTHFADFLAPLTRCLTAGLLLWPDYGFARPEFYHPDRKEDTSAVRKIFWDPKTKELLLERGEQVENLSKNFFGVEIVNVKFSYFTNHNDLITDHEWVEDGDLQNITGIQIEMEARFPVKIMHEQDEGLDIGGRGRAHGER